MCQWLGPCVSSHGKAMKDLLKSTWHNTIPSNRIPLKIKPLARNSAHVKSNCCLLSLSAVTFLSKNSLDGPIYFLNSDFCVCVHTKPHVCWFLSNILTSAVALAFRASLFFLFLLVGLSAHASRLHIFFLAKTTTKKKIAWTVNHALNPSSFCLQHVNCLSLSLSLYIYTSKSWRNIILLTLCLWEKG